MTPSPEQPAAQKPSASKTLLSIIVLLPTLMGSYASYKASGRDTDAGYRALVTTTLQLQQEVAELHQKVDALEAEKAAHAAMTVRLTKMADELQVAQEDATEDAGVEPAPVIQHHFEARPPPATLQEAVDREKL